jgi:hypothetical protein
LFCEKDAAYFICQGKKRKDTILLNGYWRKMDNSKTGKARFLFRNEGSHPNFKRLVWRQKRKIPTPL